MVKHYQIRNLYPLIGTVISVVALMLYWNNTVTFFLSLFLMSLGLIIWWSATITLGKSFSLVPKATELIQSGIYSKIRHPIYLGFSMTWIGGALLTKSRLIVVLAICAVLSSVMRALLEEKKLVKTFGEKYMAYKKQTWF